MYINDPVIKGRKSPPKSKHNSRSSSKAVFHDESYFENVMIKQVDQLMLKCEKTLSYTIQIIKEHSDIEDDEAQVNAFHHCMRLLKEKNQKQQQKHIKRQNVVKKKILQIDDYKQRLQGQKNDLERSCAELSKEIKEQQDEIQAFEKKHQKNTNTHLQLEAQNHKIEGLQEKISDCKSKSRQQKDQFVEIQTTQFTLQAEINKEDEILRQHEQNLAYLSQYEKLKKLKEKIANYDETLKEQVTPHLQRKISKMAYIRTQLKNLTDALEEVELKIEDQNYIIMGLKEKSYLMENDDQGEVFSQYKNKYEQIYFSQKPEQDSWVQYQQYLKNLLGKQKKLQNRVRTQFNQYNRNDESFNDLARSSKKVTRERFHRKKSLRSSNQDKNVVKLPKIVKMQGKKEDKKLIKENLKEQLKKQVKEGNSQSQFQIMSLKSKDSRVSGSVIEVEFHQK